MSTKHLLQFGLAGLLALALDSSIGQAQQPQPGGGGSPPPGGGFPGGGGRGGGGRGFGGGGGGGRGMGFDPNRIADFVFNGRTSIPITELTQRDPNGPARMQAWAAQNGVTNGELTRDQFMKYMEERRAQRMAAGGGGGPAGGGPGGPGNFAPAGPGGAAPNPGGAPEFAPIVPAPIEEEEKRPVVHRPGKLPKGLPDWFAKLDTDADGQVGLYEWKEAGRSLEEFRKFDRNGDGFITVEEALRAVHSGAAVAGGSTGGAGGESAEESSSTRTANLSATPSANNGNDGARAGQGRGARLGGNRFGGPGSGKRGGRQKGGNSPGGGSGQGGQNDGGQQSDNGNN